MKEAFHKLSIIAKKLNDQMHDVDMYINDMQAQLIQLQVGVTIWYSEPFFVEEKQYWLGYIKFDKKWQIVVKLDNSIRPLLSANKYVRIQSIKYIVPMILQLTDKVNAYADETRKASEAISKMIIDMDQNVNKEGVRKFLLDIGKANNIDEQI